MTATGWPKSSVGRRLGQDLVRCRAGRRRGRRSRPRACWPAGPGRGRARSGRCRRRRSALRRDRWATSWVLLAVGSPVPMSRNCRMPASPARYCTARPRNARLRPHPGQMWGRPRSPARPPRGQPRIVLAAEPVVIDPGRMRDRHVIRDAIRLHPPRLVRFAPQEAEKPAGRVSGFARRHPGSARQHWRLGRR